MENLIKAGEVVEYVTRNGRCRAAIILKVEKEVCHIRVLRGWGYVGNGTDLKRPVPYSKQPLPNTWHFYENKNEVTQ